MKWCIGSRWCSDLAHSNKENSTQNFFSTQRESFFYHTPHEKFFFKRKKFSNLLEKNNFLFKEKMSCIYQKKSDQRKYSKEKIIIFVWKTNFLYILKKVKDLHFRCVLNMALPSFVLTKVNKLAAKRKLSVLLTWNSWLNHYLISFRLGLPYADFRINNVLSFAATFLYSKRL